MNAFLLYAVRVSSFPFARVSSSPSYPVRFAEKAPPADIHKSPNYADGRNFKSPQQGMADHAQGRKAILSRPRKKVRTRRPALAYDYDPILFCVPIGSKTHSISAGPTTSTSVDPITLVKSVVPSPTPTLLSSKMPPDAIAKEPETMLMARIPEVTMPRGPQASSSVSLMIAMTLSIGWASTMGPALLHPPATPALIHPLRMVPPSARACLILPAHLKAVMVTKTSTTTTLIIQTMVPHNLPTASPLSGISMMPVGLLMKGPVLHRLATHPLAKAINSGLQLVREETHLRSPRPGKTRCTVSRPKRGPCHRLGPSHVPRQITPPSNPHPTWVFEVVTARPLHLRALAVVPFKR